MTTPQRVLLVRPSALGDVCRTVPVLASLRAAFPQTRLEWVVRDSLVDAISAHPALDEAIAFPRGRFGRWWQPRVARELLAWARDLRARAYDLVIDCQGLGRSGLITWWTRAATRIGSRAARELAWLGYTARVPGVSDAHTVDAMLSLLPAAGVAPVADMRLYVPEDARVAWRERRETLGLAGEPYWVLAPTARWASKRWPIERWRELAAALAERGPTAAVVIGAPDETTQARPLFAAGRHAGRVRLHDLVGQTTVGQSMAIIAGAEFVVATDSAPLHMAVGLERPCVGLFGPTDPRIVGPYGRPEAVVRRAPADVSVNYRGRSAGDALLRRIEVGDVLERLAAVLDSDAPRRGVSSVTPTDRTADCAARTS